ncbi:MAG: UrcA family protein [Pseudomonadota bacterium]
MTGMKVTLAVVAAAAIGAGSVVAQATTDVKFGYYAYELKTKQGMKRVLRRMENKVEAACGVRSRMSLSERADAKTCKAELMDELLDEIGEPSLTAMWAKDEVKLASKR